MQQGSSSVYQQQLGGMEGYSDTRQQQQQHGSTQHKSPAAQYHSSTGYPGQQGRHYHYPYHHQPHYHTPPAPHPYEDMKSQFHHQTKYSCSSHSSGYLGSEFHSRQYPASYPTKSHYPGQSANYRQFSQAGPDQQPDQYKRVMPSANVSHHIQEAAVQASSGTTFSVTHLVNSRKGSKRSSSGAAGKSSKASRTSDKTEPGKTGQDKESEPGYRKTSRATTAR